MDRFSFFCGLFRLSSDHVRGDDPFYPTRSSNASFVPARAFVDVADHDSFRVRGCGTVCAWSAAQLSVETEVCRARLVRSGREVWFIVPRAHGAAPRTARPRRCPETILVRPAGPTAPAPSRITDMAAPRATRVYAVTGTGTGTGPVR